MNSSQKTSLAVVLLLYLLISSCSKDMPWHFPKWKDHPDWADQLPNQVVIDWSNIAYQAAGGPAEGNPLLASRAATMMHIAIHDALNNIVPVYDPYTFRQQADCSVANPFAAVASAAHTVLKAAWPDSASMLDARLATSLSSIPNGPAKTLGIQVGVASGKAILAKRSGDNAFQFPFTVVPVSTVPGVYNAVPPYAVMFGSFWKTMQLYALTTQDQFMPPPPPLLSGPVYAKDFNEIKEAGRLTSATRTADESEYAQFWYEFSDIGWNRIARVHATAHHTGLYTTARMFALLNIAIADTYTACWNAKYHYFTWRPYTAIRAADTDGNNKTTAEKDWQPFMITPPVPEYPSGHASLANAAATVLTHFFGNNSSFAATSSTYGTTRSFKNFKQAADENAHSRIVAGIHFRFACDAGQKLGDKIGTWTLNHSLKPR